MSQLLGRIAKLSSSSSTVKHRLCFSKSGSFRQRRRRRRRIYNDDSTIRITNVYNPSASVSSHKAISLPPLKDVRSISLSASPKQQDCVDAAMSGYSSLSLFRLGDSDWTRIGEVSCFASKVTYSVRDKKLYLFIKKGQEYNGPLDLIKSSSSFSGFPQMSLYKRFPLSEIPTYRGVNTSETTQNLVESPSGDSFIVYW